MLLLLAACGDNLGDVDGVGPGPTDDVNPVGTATPTPRYVPSVCGVQSWTADLGTTRSGVGMNVSVAPRPEGAVMLATPRTGGSPIGIVLDTRMDMVSAPKLGIDGTFTQVVASYAQDRVTATGVSDGAVTVHVLGDDISINSQSAKVPGTQIADPAFYKSQHGVMMPVAGDDGLWFHLLDPSFNVVESKQVLATKPVRSMTAAQLGVAVMTAWSTDSECYLMLSSTFSAGPYTRVPFACPNPRISVDLKTGDGVVTFDSPEGVRALDIKAMLYGGGGAARLLRPETSAPRTLFDGTNHWVSYLDSRGDIIVGFLDANGQPVTMSLAGPKPAQGAYELVMVEHSPWVFSLGDDGYSAYRMCVDAQW
jgi:hypothetical protein